MPVIDPPDRSFLLQKIHQFQVSFYNSFSECFSRVFQGRQLIPQEVQKIYTEMTELFDRLNKLGTASCLEITQEEAALLRQAILRSRLREARFAEEQSRKTFHAELQDYQWAPVKEYDAIMNRGWFREAAHRTLPKLSDFVPIEYAQTPTWQTTNSDPKQRQFDEKFHILQAPTLFISDMDEFREASELRALSFAVAFIDIDDFKILNKKYTETVIDREVLPSLMRCMESHVYKRGYAYRQGGDEYLSLIYNTPKREAIAFIDALREKIERLRYRGIDEKLTVSIGIVCADEECHFTSRELEARASKAKAFAKERGKKCVATYKGGSLEETDLYIDRVEIMATAARESESSS